jgi:DNA-binding CsgD family transcriptional regulator
MREYEGVILFDRVDEKRSLDDLVSHVHDGVSRALVLHGEAGMGKTVLLDYAASKASCAVARISGVEAEQSFGFAALHRLLVPFLDQIVLLPSPQRAALESAFGVVGHLPPDRYMVGLAALGILAMEGTKSRLLCIVDDAQWIDHESLQALAFVGRRLNAEGVGLLFGLRTHLGLSSDLTGISAMEVSGLPPDAAAELLSSAAHRPLAQGVIEQIVRETNGCPLALRELGVDLADRPAGAGMGHGETLSISRRVEEHFLQQVAELPRDTQLFLLVAAADTSGIRGVVEAAAGQLGCSVNAELAALHERILIPGQQIRFRHPLIRSAVYSSADSEQRRLVHQTLSTVVGKQHSDLWARHVVLGAEGPSEALATELESASEIARSRGGYSAQMVLLTSAADLSEAVELRSSRLLRAARAAISAGANEQAGALLDRVEGLLTDPIAVGEALLLRGQLTVLLYQPAEAPALLLAAARQFLPWSTARCREALLETFGAYTISQHFTTEISASDIAQLATELETHQQNGSLEDHLVHGIARLIESGPCDAFEHLRETARFLREEELTAEQLATVRNFGFIVANELLDDETHRTWSCRVDRYARDTGALPVLLFNIFGQVEDSLRAGHLDAATAYYEEALDVASAMGLPAEYYHAMDVKLQAWAGNETATLSSAESLTAIASAVGVAATVAMAHQALAIPYVGQCRYREALDATEYLCGHGVIGFTTDILALAVEAAAGTGDDEKAKQLLGELETRALTIGSPWLLGLHARSQALLADSRHAEALFESSIGFLRQTSVQTDVAHTCLLYGEWLRRANRRSDARTQLRQAYDFFAAMGANAFAKRAETALLATGERTGTRSPPKKLELTPQELRVAQLAADRLTNAEIAAQLFISSATVDYHLRKVFRKLDIESRRQLSEALKRAQSV